MRIASLKIQAIKKGKNRFDGEHYLNLHSFYSLALENRENYCSALEDIAIVFNPPVFKRQFCKKTARAVPYFQSSDVQLASEKSSVYVFKGQAEKLNLLVKQGDILVTGFGTIGNVRLVSRFQEDTCYANNVCRIRVNPGVRRGVVYAFMASKYGNAQLNKNASGSVVRYIEAPGIRKTLVPVFPEEFQIEVDNLIQESARLREEAADALEEAHRLIENRFNSASDKKSSRVTIQSILSSHNKRFEAIYHSSENRSVYDYIINNCQYVLLGDKSVSKLIFKPNIFKRQYVDKNGCQLIGGADMLKRIPSTDKMISKKQVENMPSLKLKRNYILVTRAGTIGNVAFVDNQLKELIVSEDVLRVVPTDDNTSYYLYAFLSSKIGLKLISLFTYGSVIQHIESQHLELVPIPLLEKDTMKLINSLVSSYVSKIEISKEKETKAISMVEQEIEKWNN